MSHHISAVLLLGPFDEQRATAFDLKAVRLTPGLTLFPLDARYTDFWAGRLGIPGFVDCVPLLNSEVIHHIINAVSPDPLFAVIETDYFGGVGSQAAGVYRGHAVVMPPVSTAVRPWGGSVGPINESLRLLGVRARGGQDEFDTVGLGRYRDFCNWFDDYDESDPPAGRSAE